MDGRSSLSLSLTSSTAPYYAKHSISGFRVHCLHKSAPGRLPQISKRLFGTILLFSSFHRQYRNSQRSSCLPLCSCSGLPRVNLFYSVLSYPPPATLGPTNDRSNYRKSLSRGPNANSKYAGLEMCHAIQRGYEVHEKLETIFYSTPELAMSYEKRGKKLARQTYGSFC